jgi:hypothetical protein
MGLPRHPLPPAPIPAGEDWPVVGDDALALIPPQMTVLRAVVRALGWGRAGEWLADHGGVPVVVPMRQVMQPHVDAANRVFMPKADKLFLRARDAGIRRERAKKSLTVLAREYRLTSRHIQNICREGEDRQASLF